ncbi:MAG: hypothetical protein DMF73_10165 [Acidobacteria bacterium]|nr:MAG: hypothetical protein DMF73_10165 [Acidobacteriota bacterium]
MRSTRGIAKSYQEHGYLVGAVHLNRLRRLGSTAATWLGQSPLPAETLAIAVNRRYLIESIAAISKFVRVIRVHS